jgi:hypothetical protein
MKTIKIKVWDYEYKKMTYPNNGYAPSNYFSLGEDLQKSRLAYKHELILFTGQVDKNGKDIYFDDLVKAPSGKIFKVIWDDEGLSIRLQTNDLFYYNFNVPLFEVVGNIYQDEELFINQ